MTQTGASADEWVPARPGTEGVLALGLAQRHPRREAQAGRGGGPRRCAHRRMEPGLASYTPEAVEKLTGVAAARVERLAREFAERGPAVAIVGGPPLAHTNGLFTALAVNALNALVGSVDQPGGMSFTPQLDVAATSKLPAPAPRTGLFAAATGRRDADRRRDGAAAAGARRRQSGVHGAPGLEGSRRAAEGAVHRQLRQLPRRDQRAGRPDPARPLVPRVVDRRRARVGLARLPWPAWRRR